jgi:membrane protein
MAIEPIKWPTLSGWKQILVRTWKEAGDDDVGLLAAGVAFYFFLAFVPLLASIVLTYGLIADPSTVAEHIRALAQSLPREAAAIIGDQLQAITGEKEASHGLGLLLAIGLAIYGASKGAGAIVKALNIAYEVKESRGFIKTALLALAITVGLMVIIAAATAAGSAIGFIEHLLPFSSPVVHVLLQIVSALFAVAAVGLGIALLYRYGPDRPDAPWAWVTPGSAAATLLWVAASTGFGLYVSNFGNYNATYGSLGGVVVFLTWLYITSYVLLMGGELNSELEFQQAEEAAAEAGQQPTEAVGQPPAGPAPALVPASPVPAPIARQQEENGSKAKLAVLVGGGAMLGLKLWRGRKRQGDGTVFYEYPEEGAKLRLDV